MCLNILASSANNRPWDSISSRKSLIYTTKRISPRTLPWGMPLSTQDDVDSEPYLLLRVEYDHLEKLLTRLIVYPLCHMIRVYLSASDGEHSRKPSKNPGR